MTDLTKSALREDLVRLHMRLNVFFTSGYVVHAPWGENNISEIDVLSQFIKRFTQFLRPDVPAM